METINDRMELLVNERFNGNKAAFSKAIAVEPTTMSSYLGKQRRSKPSVDMVTKIVVSLNVDARWLLTGEGSPYEGAAVPSASPAPSQPKPSSDVRLEERIKVLEEKNKALEALLSEKERLINVLLDMRK